MIQPSYSGPTIRRYERQLPRSDVSCPDADDGTATIAGLLGVDISGASWQPGDVNRDGAVDMADAVIVLRVAGGFPVGGADVSLVADADGDGLIGISDAAFILQDLSLVRE